MATNFKELFLKEWKLSHFRKILNREIESIQYFYLTRQQMNQLNHSKLGKKLFLFAGWTLKALFLNLSIFRRFLLIAGFFFLYSPQNNSTFFGTIILIFILLLELKDKIIARGELKTGRSIQKELLPNDSHQVTGWDIWTYSRPAREVGGDIVDFIQLDNSSYGLSLGDVSGKGLGAALLGTKLQATIRALAPNFPDLQNFAFRLNKIFHRDTNKKSFASLVFLKICADNNHIEYFNAGHLPPLKISGNKFQFAEKGDMGIGLSGNAKYTTQNCSLASGELFVIVSDGVTEARDEDGNFFDDDRLCRIFQNKYPASAGKIGEILLKRLDNFTQYSDQFDDISIIILRRK